MSGTISALSVGGMEKQYGRKSAPVLALSDVSFTVEKDEVTGIMGPSRAGKSALLNLIATIEPPSAGRRVVDGVDATAMRKAELLESL